MSTTIDIRLPDGAIKQMPNGSTPFEVAQSISEGLARAVISASYNGTTIETTTPLQENGELVLYSWTNDEGKKAFWHSSAHLLAQALEQLYPGIKLTIGPAIDSGFYYDIDPGEHSISEKDLTAIEKRMIELARGKHAFSLRSVAKAEALSFYKAAGNEWGKSQPDMRKVENLGPMSLFFQSQCQYPISMLTRVTCPPSVSLS